MKFNKILEDPSFLTILYINVHSLSNLHSGAKRQFLKKYMYINFTLVPKINFRGKGGGHEIYNLWFVSPIDATYQIS